MMKLNTKEDVVGRRGRRGRREKKKVMSRSLSSSVDNDERESAGKIDDILYQALILISHHDGALRNSNLLKEACAEFPSPWDPPFTYIVRRVPRMVRIHGVVCRFDMDPGHGKKGGDMTLRDAWADNAIEAIGAGRPPAEPPEPPRLRAVFPRFTGTWDG